jgi:polyphenol oxidase
VLLDDGHVGRIGDADGIASNRPGCLLGVRTADCVPILLADPHSRAVAAVHAGWRGTVSNVARAAVSVLRDAFRSNPDHLVAAVGPSIGKCCFEVGPEVAAEFTAIFAERTDLNRKTTVDLREANRRQLLAAGLRPEHIHIPPATLCTRCDAVHFHSWRRDRENSGRMWSVIGIRVAQP